MAAGLLLADFSESYGVSFVSPVISDLPRSYKSLKRVDLSLTLPINLRSQQRGVMMCGIGNSSNALITSSGRPKVALSLILRGSRQPRQPRQPLPHPLGINLVLLLGALCSISVCV